MVRPALVILAVLMWLPPAFAGTDSFYCGDRLVEIGARGEAVAQRCGVPDFSEQWEEELVQKSHGDFERSTSIGHAEWIYDFGSSRFIRVLSFRDGVLKRIDVRGYGPDPAGQCTERIVSPGETKYEVWRKCGEPQTRQHARETRTEPIDNLHRRRHAVVSEHWHYAAKSGHLPWSVVFQNRRVVRTETGTNPN